MPPLDLRSIALTLALSSAALTLMLWFVSRDRDHPIAGLRLWVLGAGMIALGMALNALQDVAPDIATRGAANVFITTSIAVVWSGVRAFQGRTAALVWPISVAILIFAMSLATLYLWPSFRWRVVLFSLMTGVAALATGIAFFRERRRYLLVAARFGGAPLLLLGVLMFARAWEALMNPNTPTSLTPTPINVLTYLLGGLVLLASITAMMMLVHGVRSAQLREMAFSDPLTGALSRRGLFARLPSWLAEYSRAPTVAVIDANGFKTVNDQLGHEAGDEMLRLLATSFRAEASADRLFARIGGDEFALLCPDESQCGDALALARDRCEAALDRRFPATIRPRPAFSAGLARIETASAEGVTAALKLADQRMYAEKRALQSMRATPDTLAAAGATR